jgi:hypothetical protein
MGAVATIFAMFMASVSVLMPVGVDAAGKTVYVGGTMSLTGHIY